MIVYLYIAATTERQYISVTDTAIELRKALKAAFPSVKFSVKSKKYSGGASIDIFWTDGPTTHMVDKVGKRFQGATFDGMDNSMHYHDSIYGGKRVAWGANFVHTSRTVSQALLREAANRIAKRFGIDDMPKVMLDKWGSAQLDQAHPATHQRQDEHSHYDLSDLVHQESYRLYQYNGTIYRIVD